jgi:hypothetical protein
MTVSAGGGAGADLDEIMQNHPGGFPNAKATLRFYLQERKRMIESGKEFDLATAQGVWYLVEPHVPTKPDGEFVDRKTFVSYIRDICKDELHCRREDLKIVAGGRADLYFDGDWTSISWDNIEDLSDSGTDGILIEKDGMSRIFEPFVDDYAMAVINTRGFFVDYLGDVLVKSIDKKSNLVLIRDFDPSGLLIELGAKQLGIPCIGVNDEMLQYLGLERKDVQDRHPPSNQNSHWKKVKNLAKMDPKIRKEIEFLSKYRIEIDKVHVKVGSKRLFEYVLHKLKEYPRDLNRVAFPSDYAQPYILGELAIEVHRIGKKAAQSEQARIYFEQVDYNELCSDVKRLRMTNEERIRIEVEEDPHIKLALKRIEPVIKSLKEVKTKDEDAEEDS